MDTATEPKTEEREKVGGQEALRVKATLSKSVVPALVPGVATDVDGQVWVAAGDHKVLKVRLPLQKGAVTVTFSDFNQNFVITAPKG
jgi:lipoprotein LprG